MANILIVTSSSFFSSYGGGQIYVKNLVDELLLQGIIPTIASPDNFRNLKEQYYKKCRIVSFLPHASSEEIKILLDGIKPSIVHAHGYKALFASACVEMGIPCVITAHHGGIVCPAGTLLNHKDEICRISANPEDCLPCVLKNIRWGIYAWPLLMKIPLHFRIRLGRCIERLPFILYFTPVLQASLSIKKKEWEWKTIYKNASLIIAPSSAIAESMMRNGCQVKKIQIEPHGIPLPDINLVCVKTEAGTNGTIDFFYVGRICHFKGVHVMLAAFEKVNSSARLNIIGGAGNATEQRYMDRLKRKYKSNRRIVWHGKIDSQKINEMIVNYDIMVHPAICLEVFGLTIAEALALGKPVIATRCGGAEMQIVEGGNGLLVKPNDELLLADAMQKMIQKSKMIKTGTAEAVRTVKDHVSAIIGLYNTIPKP